jgi:hypothetical protein
MENRINLLGCQRPQPVPQVNGSGESFDLPGLALTPPRCLLPDQQRDFVPTGCKEIHQLRAQPPCGKICQPPDFIQRLKRWPGSDHAAHDLKIASRLAPLNAKKLQLVRSALQSMCERQKQVRFRLNRPPAILRGAQP